MNATQIRNDCFWLGEVIIMRSISTSPSLVRNGTRAKTFIRLTKVSVHQSKVEQIEIRKTNGPAYKTKTSCKELSVSSGKYKKAQQKYPKKLHY